MVVKVYGTLRAACPQRVMACLFEKGLDFEVVEVDLQAGEHKKPEFLEIQVHPLLSDKCLQWRMEILDFFESRAIIRYFSAKYANQGPNLVGKTAEEIALVDQWLEVEAHNFNDLVYSIALQLLVLPQMGKPGDTSLVKSCESKLEKVLDIYEKRLGQSQYLAGNYFSLADLSHLPGIRYLMNELGMEHLVRERKNVNAWWEEISSRPAWKKVLKLAA